MELIEWIREPWPWYVAGPMLALVMLTLLYFGKNFGVSSNLRTMCSMGGAGRWADFFDFDWKGQSWNLVFVVGTAIGGYIAHSYLSVEEGVRLSQGVIEDLTALGISNPGATLIPTDIFNWDMLMTAKGMIILVGGGLLIGFGARYAGGCTSGHAISGLSDLQLPSLIAVVGFFIGGLVMTYLFLPLIFGV